MCGFQPQEFIAVAAQPYRSGTAFAACGSPIPRPGYFLCSCKESSQRNTPRRFHACLPSNWGRFDGRRVPSRLASSEPRSRPIPVPVARTERSLAPSCLRQAIPAGAARLGGIHGDIRDQDVLNLAFFVPIPEARVAEAAATLRVSLARGFVDGTFRCASCFAGKSRAYILCARSKQRFSPLCRSRELGLLPSSLRANLAHLSVRRRPRGLRSMKRGGGRHSGGSRNPALANSPHAWQAGFYARMISRTLSLESGNFVGLPGL